MSVKAAFVYMLARVLCMVGWMGICGVGTGDVGLLYIYRMEVLNGDGARKNHRTYNSSMTSCRSTFSNHLECRQH